MLLFTIGEHIQHERASNVARIYFHFFYSFFVCVWVSSSFISHSCFIFLSTRSISSGDERENRSTMLVYRTNIKLTEKKIIYKKAISFIINSCRLSFSYFHAIACDRNVCFSACLKNQFEQRKGKKRHLQSC